MRMGSSATTLVSAALTLALCAGGARAGNIDTGFAMDGVTTYCQGMTGAAPFANLESNSINRCAILVNLTPAATTVHKNEPLEIKFKAQAKFGDIPANIFPKAITNQEKKEVEGVSSSYVKYCKAGTNCEKIMDATPFGDGKDTGPFDATGAKALPSFRITFPDPGDYVVFGQVSLPGDAELKVSGKQFVTFQKITVVDTGVSIAPSPSPTPSMPAAATTPAPGPSSSAPPAATNGTGVGFNTINGNKTAGSVAGESVGTVKSTATDKAPSAVAATEIPTEGTSTKGADEEDKGFFASHGALLGAVAGVCVVVLVIGYAVAMRRKNKNVQAGKPQRGQTPTFRVSRSDHMDDPEPVAYISKKTTRNSANQHSLPILGGAGTSSSSTDDMPMDMHKRGSELEPSYDDVGSSYEEGTVTASNKAIPTQARGQPQHQQYEQSTKYHQSRPSGDMAPSSLYDDRETALYQNKPAKQSVRASEQESDFYQSTGWDAAATAHPYDDQREVSTISFNDDDSNSRRGFAAPSFASDTVEDFEDGRMTRFNSEASVDSYAFRPSRASVAESYQSRVSRYSYADSELDRDSSRISGMSLYSDRGTNV